VIVHIQIFVRFKKRILKNITDGSPSTVDSLMRQIKRKVLRIYLCSGLIFCGQQQAAVFSVGSALLEPTGQSIEPVRAWKRPRVAVAGSTLFSLVMRTGPPPPVRPRPDLLFLPLFSPRSFVDSRRNQQWTERAASGGIGTLARVLRRRDVDAVEEAADAGLQAPAAGPARRDQRRAARQ
jgi:hypothetical protein